VILPGARVGSGATVVDSIVAGEVEPAATVASSVIGRTHRVLSGTHVEGETLPPPA
jgi:hypothetical protein